MTDIQKEEKERAEFEAWFSDNGVWLKSLERSGDGYLLMAAQSAWRVWQAARRSQPEGWISVSERLPEVGVTVLVYAPPEKHDWPDTIRISFDCIDPDADDPTFWMEHGAHYEHYCCVAKPEGTIGPSAKAPYTHWQPLPPPPIAAAPDGREG